MTSCHGRDDKPTHPLSGVYAGAIVFGQEAKPHENGMICGVGNYQEQRNSK